MENSDLRSGAHVRFMAVSPQVKCIFTMSRTRVQHSSQTCGLHSQSSAVVTHCLLIAPRIPSPEGWKPESSLSAPGNEPGPPAHISEHVLERLTL